MGLDQLFRVSHREGRLDVGILPAATQGHAHADHGIEAVTQGVGQAQLGAEQLAFGIQHGQVIGVTVVVLQAGDLRGAAQAVHLGLAGRHDGVGLALGGQGGAHVLEGVLHRLAVHGDGRFLLGLGVLDVIPGAAEVQQRHGAGHAVAPGARRTAEQVHHAGAEGAQHARQGNGREELGTGHADIGVVGHDHVLGSAHVGTALQQLGRQAGRQHGRGRQLADVTAARHDGAHDVTGRAAQQHGQAGFGAVHGHRGAVHLGTGRFHFGAGTLPVQLRDVALTVAAGIDAERILTRTQGTLGRGQLHVQGQQGKVALGRLAGHRKAQGLVADHGVQQHVRQHGVVVAVLAPEVQFPAGRELALVVHVGTVRDAVVVGDLGGVALRGGRTGAAHRGGELAGAHAQLGRGGIDLGQAFRQILVVLQGFFHQGIEHGIIEAGPPVGVQRTRSQIHGTPLLGDVLLGTLIVGSQGAARDGQAEHQRQARFQQGGHISSSSSKLFLPSLGSFLPCSFREIRMMVRKK